MTQDKNRDETRGHEAQGCQHRARRQAGDTANAVAAGAARAITGADTDQQAGDDQAETARLEMNRR